MDKEDVAMSQNSTNGSADQVKQIPQEDREVYMQKRQNTINDEFTKLVGGGSDSGKVCSGSVGVPMTVSNYVDQDEAQAQETNRRRPRNTPELGIRPANRTSRNRQSFTEKTIFEYRDSRCANPSCSITTKLEPNAKFQRMKNPFSSKTELFCESCAEAIKSKWICQFCQGIYSATNEENTWAQCDNKKCGKWAHLNCEAKINGEDIAVYLNESSKKFFCNNCLPNYQTDHNKRKFEQSTSSKGYPEEALPHHVQAVVAADPLEVRVFLTPQNRFQTYTEYQYVYLYSEAYQPITKVVSDSRCPITAEAMSILLPESEIAKDFELFFKATSDRRFCLEPKPEKENTAEKTVINTADKHQTRKKLYKNLEFTSRQT